MDYRRFGNKIVLRLDVGDEIINSITKLAKEENIKLGSITGIGATNNVEFGLFNPADKKYNKNFKKEDLEIMGLNGNISTLDDEVYIHLHITLSDADGNAFGGHLNKAIISVTSEIFINVIDGEIKREFDDNIGINVIKF